MVTQNTTPDIKYTVTAPSGSTCNLVANEFETGVSAISNTCGGSMPLLIASGNEGTTVSGTIITSTTAGTIQLQAAQNSLSALATSINTGSSFVAYRLRGADLAEVYYSQDNSISEGMLVSLTQAGMSQVQKSEIPYDMNVLGVVSTKPGLVIGEADGDEKPIIVGLAGRVPVKVTNQNGAIQAGDYITTSSIPGIGMKATEPGQVVGKALTGLPEDVEEGEIIVFIQNSYFDGLYTSMNSTADYGQELISNDSRTVLENGSIADRLTHLVRRALERLSSVFIDFKAWIRELKAEKIETQELCVGNVCVTEQQFLELFESNNIDYSTNEETDDVTEEESSENTEDETSDGSQETNGDTGSGSGTESETQDNSNETTTPDQNTPTGESESNPSSGDETGSGESSSDTSSGGESLGSTSSGDSTDSNQSSDTSDSGEGSGESSPSGDGGESQN